MNSTNTVVPSCHLWFEILIYVFSYACGDVKKFPLVTSGVGHLHGNDAGAKVLG
jgi:hypothetical protein